MFLETGSLRLGGPEWSSKGSPGGSLPIATAADERMDYGDPWSLYYRTSLISEGSPKYLPKIVSPKIILDIRILTDDLG